MIINYFLETILYLLENGSKSSSPLQYSINSPAMRMGHFLIVLYNTAQLTLEMITIVLLVCNYDFQWKGEAYICSELH